MTFWERDEPPAAADAERLLLADELIEREAWPAELAEDLALQRLRMERRALTDWERRLVRREATVDRRERSLWIAAGVVSALLIVSTLALMLKSGGVW